MGVEKTARERWQERYAASRLREADFTTLSGMDVEPAYGTEDGEWPGEFPFTRGLHASGNRGRTCRLW
jgi:methylmalonyl-CoA mutase N-terminal domain/subunit